ncbi:MAG: DUF6261 family protein [Mangrovibacterium sp.]
MKAYPKLRLVESYAKAGLSNKVTLKLIIDELFQVTQLLTEAIERDKILSRLKEFEHARDKAFKDFFTLMKGYHTLETSPQYEAEQRVFKVLDKYGTSSTTKPDDAQTGSFNSLIDELSKDKMQADISALYTLRGNTKHLLPHTKTSLKNIAST